MSSLAIAYRGTGADWPTGIPLPPARAPLFRGFRMRKSWRYVGVWSETVSLCAARVRVGPVPQEFWGVWHRSAGRVDLTPGALVVDGGYGAMEDHRAVW